MSKAKIFFYACLFFISGVFIRSVFDLNFFIIYLVFLLSLIFFVLSRQNKYFLVMGIWLIFLVLGVWRYQIDLPTDNESKIYHYNQQEVDFVGLVSKEPDAREDKVRYEIQAEQIILLDNPLSVSGKVLVTNYLYPQFDYGDQVKIRCLLQRPEQIEDFSYDKYLARYHIYSLCYYPRIEVLAKDKGNPFLAAIFRMKNYSISKISRILPEPQASFLGGLLIGAKKSIPSDLTAVFNKTGTTHIVAVSGYNIAIIAAFLLSLAQYVVIGRKKAFWLIVAILLVFAIITGLQASIIRATIMGCLVLLAKYLGRLSRVNNVLVLTAVLMLLINPQILVFDLGFQLSFLATIGLIYLAPVLLQITRAKKLKNKVFQLILADYFLTTLAAIIITTPLILFNFGKISVVAPLANILVLPLIPLAMMLGFVTLILALILEPIGWVCGWIVWLVLQYIIWILTKLANLPWAYYEVKRINFWVMAGLYVLILGVVYRFKKKAA